MSQQIHQTTRFLSLENAKCAKKIPPKNCTHVLMPKTLTTIPRRCVIVAANVVVNVPKTFKDGKTQYSSEWEEDDCPTRDLKRFEENGETPHYIKKLLEVYQ